MLMEARGRQSLLLASDLASLCGVQLDLIHGSRMRKAYIPFLISH